MVLTRKRIIIALIAILAVVGIAVGAYLLYRHTYSATINLYFAPQSADVKIGSGSGKFGDNFVKPGTYKVVISKKGFATYTEEVTVKAGDIVGVDAALTSTSSETANWYQDHPDDYTIAQTIGDRKADNEHEKFVAGFPIVKVLPIVGLYNSYRVDYGPSPTVDGQFALFIRYQSEAAKQEALKAIKSKGYDADSYEVIYQSSAPTEGTVSFPGMVTLTDRGMGSTVLRATQRILAEKYTSSQAVELNFADDANHVVKEDGALHSYSASFTVNGGASQVLTVDVRDMTTMEVRVGSETLYSGNIY